MGRIKGKKLVDCMRKKLMATHRKKISNYLKKELINSNKTLLQQAYRAAYGEAPVASNLFLKPFQIKGNSLLQQGGLALFFFDRILFGPIEPENWK